MHRRSQVLLANTKAQPHQKKGTANAAPAATSTVAPTNTAPAAALAPPIVTSATSATTHAALTGSIAVAAATPTAKVSRAMRATTCNAILRCIYTEQAAAAKQPQLPTCTRATSTNRAQTKTLFMFQAIPRTGHARSVLQASTNRLFCTENGSALIQPPRLQQPQQPPPRLQ